MNAQQPNSQSIIFEQGLKYTQAITNLGIILYKRYQLDKLQIFLKRKCQEHIQVCLISQGEHFWLVKACEQENEAEYEQIERIVGLTETIVCIDLPNPIESFVEKMFWNTKNQFNAYASNNKLVFIKDIYNNKQNSWDIRYFRNVNQALCLFEDKNLFVTTPLTVADLMQLFDCEKPENIPKVKAIYRKYQQIRQSSQKMENISNMIFNCQKSKAEILKQIQKCSLPKIQETKLVWKMKQMHRYKEWLQEEKQSHEANCWKLTFDQLNDRIDFATIYRYKKQWSSNSFARLKQYFNKINGLNDAVAIKDFHRQYKSMSDNLEKIKKRVEKCPEYSLFEEMIEELDQFFSYHQAALNDSPLNSFSFLKGEAQYIWKYKNNIYKKIGAFVLFGGLAYCQQDFLRTATFLILAILILTLRC